MGMYHLLDQSIHPNHYGISNRIDCFELRIFIQMIAVWSIWYIAPISLLTIYMIDSVLNALIYIGNLFNFTFVEYLKLRVSVLCKYVYITLLIFSLWIAEFLTWWRVSPILYSFGILCTVPLIVEGVSGTERFKGIVNWVYETLIRRTLSKIVSSIVNLIAVRVLKIDPMFDRHEFEKIIDSISLNNGISRFTSFISTFISFSILNYFEIGYFKIFVKLYKKYYYWDKKRVCDSMEYLRDIFRQRKWNRLLDEYTLDKLIRIYAFNDKSDSDVMRYVKKEIEIFKIKIKEIVCCYAISSLMKRSWLGPLTSLLFIKEQREIPIILSIFFISVFFNSIPICAFLTIMVPELLLREISIRVIKDVYKEIILGIERFYYVDDLILGISITVSFPILLYDYHILISIISTLFFILSCEMDYIKRDRTCILVYGTYIFGMFSNFNVVHSSLIPFILHFIMLCFKKSIRKKKDIDVILMSRYF